MKKALLVLAAFGEAATGATLLIVPSIVGRLLCGVDLTGSSVSLARLAGIALISLGISLWPGPALAGMTIYSVCATVYLILLGIGGQWTGILLWPAVLAHAILTILLGRTWLMTREEF
jgi:hypothetical protein